MKNLILEIKKIKQDWCFSTNTYTLEITEDVFKEFQQMVIKWCPEDTNVFFNLED